MGPPTANSSAPMQRIVNNAMNDANELGGAGSLPEGSRKITLYRNGFTVDDGPLRDLESPENKQFLASLSDGYIPREVILEQSFIVSSTLSSCKVVGKKFILLLMIVVGKIIVHQRRHHMLPILVMP